MPASMARSPWGNWVDPDDPRKYWGMTLSRMRLAPPPSPPPKHKNMLRWIAETAVQTHKALQKPTELAGFLALLADIQPRPRIMVEIGCDAGGTLWAWKQIGIPRVIGIEYPEEHSDDDNPWGTENPLVPHGCEILRADSHADSTRVALSDMLVGQPIDVLFIDADHTYEGVKRDYLMYAPMVANEGMIALHDVSPHPHHPGVGVQRFWQQIKGDKEEILLAPEYWGGIGIVRQWREELAAVVNR